MRRTISRLILIPILILCSVAYAAEEFSSRRQVDLTIAGAFVDLKEFSTAEEILKNYLKANDKDAEVWQGMGKLRLKQSKFSEAIESFNRAASLTAENARAANQYYLADAKVQSGDDAGAKQILMELKEIPEFSTSAIQALDGFKPNRPLPPLVLSSHSGSGGDGHSPLKVTGSVKTGYTSNVLTVPDIATTTKPDSFLISPAAQVGYSQQALGGDLGYSFIAMYTDNFATTAIPYNSAYFSLGANWSGPGDPAKDTHQWTLSDSGDVSFLNSSGSTPYVLEDTLTFGYAVFLSKDERIEFQIPIGYQAFPGIVPTDTADGRNGPTLGAGVTHRTTVGDLSFSEQISYTYQLAAGSNFIMQKGQVSLRASTKTYYDLDTSITLTPNYSVYPFNNQNRKDTNFSFVWDFTRKISNTLPLSGTLSFELSRNVSNLSTAQYTNNGVNLKLSYDLL